MNSQSLFLSPNQFWRELNKRGVPIGRTTVFRAAKAGELKTMQVGSHTRIAVSELDDWPDRLATNAPPTP